ncbi:LysR family transcriptional regulator [Antarcticirhabdus aurantiaca]|uniref:LysR family transcriptional regulator n=1 Tax=Antarcticirhabdus aurantiaca TaxID=2606717 RepID=A0ACD4NU38_9HYPH|nr:LysR family transcriptional regulator [Antarcticirhabdus aurantiaca]WAJ30230.1 LysR family transcriptional regulator [Jeongeuplla avenae]
MRNLPTDLLRALVAVIDCGGFTRAGERLGRSQSAVSLQIKRLEELAGGALFEREPGAGPPRPTEAGRETAIYARRILALNDELVERLSREARAPRLRVGLPNDYADAHLAALAEDARQAGEGEGVRLEIVCDLSVNLLKRFRDGELDLVVAQTPSPAEAPAGEPVRRWRDPLAWVGRAPNGTEEPVRLLAYPEGCNYRREMLAALTRAGLAHEIVCVTPSLSSLEAMLRAGFGVTALSVRAIPAGLGRLAAADGLPALAPLEVGIHARAELGRGPEARLAARFAEAFAERFDRM